MTRRAGPDATDADDATAGPDEPVETVEARGRRCPVPVIELARAAARHQAGAVLEVLADDAAARTDVPAWCRLRGHDYLGERPADGGGGGGTAYRVRLRT